MGESKPVVERVGGGHRPYAVLPEQTISVACDAASAAAAATVARLGGLIVPPTRTRHVGVLSTDASDWTRRLLEGHVALRLTLQGELTAALLVALPNTSAQEAAKATLRLAPGVRLRPGLAAKTTSEILSAAAGSYLREFTARPTIDLTSSRVGDLGRWGPGPPLDIFLSRSPAPQRLLLALIIERPLLRPLAERLGAAP